MPTLPSYAKIMAAGYAEQPQPTVLRTEMESGPPKQARVVSRGMVVRPVQLRIDTLANYLAWRTWVKDTLQGGALWFDYTDPLTATTLSARLINGQYEAAPGNGASLTLWVVKCSFETWG